MTTGCITYEVGDSLPAFVATIPLNGASNVDFGTGWTFDVTLYRNGQGDITKSSGISGAVGAVTVEWSPDELDILPGTWWLLLKCTRVSDSRVFTGRERLYVRGR